jgi:hypothetical protein
MYARSSLMTWFSVVTVVLLSTNSSACVIYPFFGHYSTRNATKKYDIQDDSEYWHIVTIHESVSLDSGSSAPGYMWSRWCSACARSYVWM